MWRITDGAVLAVGARKSYQDRRLILRTRPLELLRLHLERIDAWILEQAGIVFDAKADPGKLRVVVG